MEPWMYALVEFLALYGAGTPVAALQWKGPQPGGPPG